jgi:hypothetical protein
MSGICSHDVSTPKWKEMEPKIWIHVELEAVSSSFVQKAIKNLQNQNTFN